MWVAQYSRDIVYRANRNSVFDQQIDPFPRRAVSKCLLKLWDKRFAIDISEFARPGEKNLIAMRVRDSLRMGGLWKSVKLVSPKANAAPAETGVTVSTGPATTPSADAKAE